jgi:predicted ATP-binding protein involved in virulence
MYISKFKVEGFRGFKDALTLELDPKVNVLVGVNGAGKSSLLDGMEMLLYSFRAKVNPITESKISNKDFVNDIKESFNSTLQLESDNGKLIYGVSQKKGHHAIFVEGNVNFHIDVKSGLPIIQYYKPSRSFSAQDLKSSNKVYAPYDETFEQGLTLFSDFKNWFVNAKNYENHVRLTKDNKYRSGYLAAIESAFLKFYSKIGADVNDYQGLDIYYEENTDFIINANTKPQLVISKKDSILNLEKLSDGEKMLLVMLGNIVKDLCNMSSFTDGPVKSISKTPEEILSGPGIVLIDEIELHLHPAWQRNIIPALTATFPNIQFIVTTHSPQVLSNVESKSVFILEDFKLVEKTPATKGKDSNSILWEIFGVEERPEEIKNLLKQFYNALEDDTEKAESLLNVLVSMLGNDDKEVQRAKYHLDIEVRLSKETD